MGFYTSHHSSESKGILKDIVERFYSYKTKLLEVSVEDVILDFESRFFSDLPDRSILRMSQLTH